MRKYTNQKNSELTEIYCNRCGKKIRLEDGRIEEGIFHGKVTWGYFSGKDMERHEFDLCEDCYDAVVHEFQIPVDRKIENELL
ncbi:MAG: hypothetical protein ACI4EO_06140 [Blautia sp.]